jgi:DNA invertase Pin-like site-specific DNA recombinase
MGKIGFARRSLSSKQVQEAGRKGGLASRKLSSAQVEEILRLLATGSFYLREIAPQFGVHKSTIQRIKTGVRKP